MNQLDAVQRHLVLHGTNKEAVAQLISMYVDVI
jgi:hypothetical protein